MNTLKDLALDKSRGRYVNAAALNAIKGAPITTNESRRLERLGASIHTAPLRPSPGAADASGAPPARVKLEDIDGLQEALRNTKTPETPPPPTIDLIAAIAAAGGTFEEFTICVDGTPEARWWPTWTSDPSAD